MSAPTLTIAQGTLFGRREGKVLRFAGIPFATAARWQMPVAAAGWSGVRDAGDFANICPQDPKQADIMKGPLEPQSEDCLYLNVWTQGCDAGRRAVLFYIHGGGFTTGSGHIGCLEGTALAARGDVVVVTINYRLGAFGFLNLRDATDGKLPGTGAEGLADQIVALQWVRDNIAAFGGDPENITIFGESAGSASVCALMASPKAKGLFRRAICESGGAHVGRKRDESALTAKALIERLGVTDAPEKMLDLPFETILNAQIDLAANPPKGAPALGFGPTIDGEVLPLRAIDAIRAGSAKGVDLIAGTAKDEARLFFLGNRKIAEMNAESLRKRVGGIAGEDNAEAMIAAYAEAKPADGFAAIVGDNMFLMPTIKLLEAQSAYAPSYGFRMDWTSPMLNGLLGACHVIEIGFVFGTHARPEVADFFGTGPEADALAAAMMDSWISFAKTGDPGSRSLPWPRYEAQARATMIFGDGAPHVVDDPAKSRRLAWGQVSEKKLGL
ncbi:MAG TPA: carboxylesterase/lipase family protein [Rhizomicrobium sp.]